MLKALGRYRRGLVVLLLLAATYLFVACGGGGGSSGTGAGPTPPPPPPGPGATFPLHTEAGKRYLIDAQGNPFLIHGDTAWSLMVQLTEVEVDQYLDDRKAKGFNTILVNLIEHNFSSNAPAWNNVLAVGPFTSPGNFSTPNNAYFDRAASIVQKAADRNMLVLMTPAYLGFGGGAEGWYSEMQTSGTNTLFDYGKYLANRFAGHGNIIWLNGGDFTPAFPDRIYHEAVVNGIRDINTTWLHSFHGDPGQAALDAVGSVPWLSVNNIYTQANDVHARGLAQYNSSTMPYFLLEARYESEPNPPATTQQLRAQAYEALLAGATGQIFGNNPIWHFQAPNSLFPYSGTWQTALNSDGSMSMQRLGTLWMARSWWLLQPFDAMITGTGHAARATDGSFALAYVTSDVAVQLDQLTGPSVVARWYNPFNGDFVPAGTFNPPLAQQTFVKPSNHGNGTDWVLVLESQ